MTTELLFAHGVKGPRSNVAGDPDYQSFLKDQAERDDNFSKYAFAGAPLNITNCLWSVFGAHPAWKLACVPHAVLGAGDSGSLAGSPRFLASRGLTRSPP